MALILKLDYVDNLKGKSPKVARGIFRDFAIQSNVARCQDGTAYFGETMRWPVGRQVEPNETITIQIFNFSKYFTKKLIGSFTMVLQTIIDEPVFRASEPLLNDHMQVLSSKIFFELDYMSPDGNLGTWSPDDLMKDDKDGIDSPDGGSMMDYDLDDILNQDSEAENTERSVSFNPNVGTKIQSSSDDESVKEGTSGLLGVSKFPTKLEPTLDKIQDYQVSVTVHECRIAASVKYSVSPAIKINVGKKHQKTNLQATDGEDHQVAITLHECRIAAGVRFEISPAVTILVGDQVQKTNIRATKGEVDGTQISVTVHECRIASGVRYTISPAIKIQCGEQVQKTNIQATGGDAEQVHFHIICARDLKGLNVSPYIKIAVGTKTQYTRTVKSTHSPYYNEEGLIGAIQSSRYKPAWLNLNKLMSKKTPRKYFVFDFRTTKAELFDQVIQLTAVATSKSIPGIKKGQKIGIFKIDVGTVYSATDHMFYHKWAVLVDPDDVGSGVKGYLKCDISVTGKGEQAKIIPKNLKDDEDDEDIEANLLLPVGVSVERQMAEIQVKIYRAEDLPQMYSDVMASVRKAIIGDNKALVDPYVCVTFAGQKGKTSSCKNTYNPLFNEAITFKDVFPPLCNRMKIQLLDDDAVKDEVIATHFIDLHQIMHPGDNGFLPQLGPSWMNFYGAPRGQSLRDKMDSHNEMNIGQGEGAAYRGRLLLSIKTDIIEPNDDEALQSGVDVGQTNPVSQNVCGLKEDFTLFCAVIDACMICEEVVHMGKPITLELTMGVYGNEIDGKGYGLDEGEEPSQEPPRTLPSNSSLTPMKAVTGDNFHYRLPIDEEKPVLYLTVPWEAHRRRCYNTNMLEKVADKVADGLVEVKDQIKRENLNAYKRLKKTLKILMNDIQTYLMYSRSTAGGAGPKTKLDKDRKKLCETQMEKVSIKAGRLRGEVCPENLKYKIREARAVLNTIRHLSREPQHSLPDAFIWMVCNKKRIAYARIPARDIIYSTCEEEKGKDCGIVRTLFLRFPGKKGLGEAAWVIPCKLQLFMWLGIDRGRKEYLTTLPQGYEMPKPLKGQKKRPPPVITYKEKFTFNLNAYMFLCRGLIGSDDSGLSDPFARVICFDKCVTTRICFETLSPGWDQLLTIENIDIYFSPDEIKKDPPMIIIEIFDYDAVGDPEFLGRAIAKPQIFMLWDEYNPPSLQWWEVYRAQYKGGELLACFELVQVGEDGQLPPKCPPPAMQTYIKEQMAKGKKEKDIKLKDAIIPIPRPIRPSVCKYRMEVLFWGVREMQKLFLMSVDRPKVDVECGGQIISSTIIENAKKKPNFEEPVRYKDLELPDNSLFWPPVMIRCVDNRQFGRTVIAGNHIINVIDKFVTDSNIPEEKTFDDYFDKNSMAGSTVMPDGSVITWHASNGDVQVDTFNNVPADDVKSMKSGTFGIDRQSIHSLAVPADSRSIHSNREGSIHSQSSSLRRQALANSLKNLSEADNRSIKSGQFDTQSIHSTQMDDRLSVDRMSMLSQRGVDADRMSLRSQRGVDADRMSLRSGIGSRSIPERLSLRSQQGVDGDKISLLDQQQDGERVSLHGGSLDRMSLHSQHTADKMSIHSGNFDNMSVKSGISYKNKQLSTIPESRRLSKISERSKGSLHPSHAASQNDLSGSRPGSRAGSVAGSRPPSRVGSQTNLAKEGDVAIDIEGKEGEPGAPPAEGKQGGGLLGALPIKPDIPGLPDANLLNPDSEPELEPLLDQPDGDPEQAQRGPKPPAEQRQVRRLQFELPPKPEPAQPWPVYKPNKRTHKRGLFSQVQGLFHKKKPKKDTEPKDAEELDWWSKYYVTLEDLVKETKEDNDKNDEEKSESSDDDQTMDMLDDQTEGSGDDVNPKETIKDVEGEKKLKELRKQRRKDRLKRMKEQLKKVRARDKEEGDDVKYEDDAQDDEKAKIERIKFYRCELENVVGYDCFEEWLQKFPLLRGKKTDDEEEDDSRCSGYFKGTLNIYKIGSADEEVAAPAKNELRLMKNLPSNDPVEVKIRIYIIRANDLHPADANGKADPYIMIALGKQIINDKKNYISKQLNPVFGKCYEMDAIFPMESMMTISVIDWDMAGSDDLIGETKIDLENRFYSTHRATCGLANKYETHGYNKWRDPVKPTAILTAICKDSGLPEPKYQPNVVKVGDKFFQGPNMIKDEHGDEKISNEPLALHALKNFQDVPRYGRKLVPEHIETRPLFTPEKPGVEQGKLELWIDMFPKTTPPDSPPIDVTPRIPKSYELRVIIWNTDEVELQEANMFSGEKSSDIFVKGWLKGFGQDDQATDVHYNSMTGEGNFNWRFVFPFDYLKSEDKIVVRQKESIFSVDETEYKIQPRLFIQCWDADIVSSDDFIGSFMLHLSKFPRAAKSVKACKKEMLNTDGSQPQISIFKNRRVKGWYPFVALDEGSGEMELKGKCEVEMHLVTVEEAETNPVGLARNEPEPLTPPKRPNYSWFSLMNPLRIAKILLRRYKCCLIKICLIIFAVIFGLLFFYSMPGYVVKKIIGA